MRKKIDLENNPKIYFSSKEVCEHFDIKDSHLRHWEKVFDSISPRKSPKGTRQYSREDIEEIEIIYLLVKVQGFTLSGAKKALKNKYNDIKRNIEVIQKLESVRSDIKNILDTMESLDNFEKLNNDNILK